jgi:hypothetical protein
MGERSRRFPQACPRGPRRPPHGIGPTPAHNQASSPNSPVFSDSLLSPNAAAPNEPKVQPQVPPFPRLPANHRRAPTASRPTTALLERSGSRREGQCRQDEPEYGQSREITEAGSFTEIVQSRRIRKTLSRPPRRSMTTRCHRTPQRRTNPIDILKLMFFKEFRQPTVAHRACRDRTDSAICPLPSALSLFPIVSGPPLWTSASPVVGPSPVPGAPRGAERTSQWVIFLVQSVAGKEVTKRRRVRPGASRTHPGAASGAPGGNSGISVQVGIRGGR